MIQGKLTYNSIVDGRCGLIVSSVVPWDASSDPSVLDGVLHDHFGCTTRYRLSIPALLQSYAHLETISGRWHWFGPIGITGFNLMRYIQGGCLVRTFWHLSESNINYELKPYLARNRIILLITALLSLPTAMAAGDDVPVFWDIRL